ncbi:MAG: hypothetical protein ACQEXC_14280 [Pseudomonadota bacterium]
MTHTDIDRGGRVLRGKLKQGAPCTLGPDEIAAANALLQARERLRADRDLWQRTAQRLEREKIALAQDVLTHGEKRRAQAEELDRCLSSIRPGATAAAIRESLYHRMRELRGETAGGEA